jgi:dienelactone hydrolase
VVLLAGTAFAGPVTYSLNGTPYEGYYVSAGENAPLVMLIHDWDGLTDYEVKRAHMLADLGYSVFAMDLFGAGIRPTEVTDKRQHTGQLYKDREKMRALMNGALDAAREQGGDVGRAVAVGYCFGGAAVLEWARSGAGLKGFVTFHGGLGTPEGQDYSRAKGRYLILHGSADQAITLADFSALAAELEGAGLDHEMITYGGARHAFSVLGSSRYNRAADMKSWDRFKAFLNGIFSGA